MKRGYACLIGAALLAATACKQSPEKMAGAQKTIGQLKLFDATPQPGETLKLQFAAKDSADKPEDFSGYYYVLTNGKSYAYDIAMIADAAGWEGEIKIPDSAQAIAFNFAVGDEFLNHDKQGYAQVLFDQEGKVLPDAWGNVAAFHNHYDRLFSLETPSDSLLAWYQKSIAAKGEGVDLWKGAYGELLYDDNKTAGKAFLEQSLTQYTQSKTPSLEAYQNMIRFYGLLRQQDKQDSIIKIASEKYPKSKLAQQAYAVKFNAASDLKTKTQIFKTYQEKVGIPGDYEDFMLRSLAKAAQDAGDMDLYNTYIKQLSNPAAIASAYNNLAWELAESGKDIDQAVSYAKQAVALVDPTTNKEKVDYLSEQQYDQRLGRMQQSYADTYAYALFKKGDLKAAITQQKLAVGEGLSPDINERYIKYLTKAEDYKTVLAQGADFIAEGASTDTIKIDFKKAYLAVKGSDKGYAEKLADLEKQAHEKLVAEVKAQLFSKSAPKLALTDAEGNAVTLADMKGKVVILDFWATWCGPCRASFPGMQQAVDYYKDNDQVQFYFVNTFQREPKEARHKKVENFISTNKYTFDILYDKNANNNFPTAEGFGITGIPTKVVIDKEGNWRFTKVGYGGSASNLVNELKVIVQLLQ